MRFDFTKEGALSIRPDDHADCMTLKYFIKELQSHGLKMIDIETDCDESATMASRSYGKEPAHIYHYHYPTQAPWPVDSVSGYEQHGTSHDHHSYGDPHMAGNPRPHAVAGGRVYRR